MEMLASTKWDNKAPRGTGKLPGLKSLSLFDRKIASSILHWQQRKKENGWSSQRNMK